MEVHRYWGPLQENDNGSNNHVQREDNFNIYRGERVLPGLTSIFRRLWWNWSRFLASSSQKRQRIGLHWVYIDLYWVYLVLLDGNKIYLVLLGLGNIYLAEPSFIIMSSLSLIYLILQLLYQFYLVLPSFNGFALGLPSFIGLWKDLPSWNWFSWCVVFFSSDLCSFTKLYWVYIGFT